jgi:hypothetical protein
MAVSALVEACCSVSVSTQNYVSGGYLVLLDFSANRASVGELKLESMVGCHFSHEANVNIALGPEETRQPAA